MKNKCKCRWGTKLKTVSFWRLVVAFVMMILAEVIVTKILLTAKVKFIHDRTMHNSQSHKINQFAHT